MTSSTMKVLSRWATSLLFTAFALSFLSLASAIPTGHGRAKTWVSSAPEGVSLVSKNFAHTAAGNNSTTTYAVSADERYVAFTSNASDLITNDLNGTYNDIFRLDRATGQIDLVSVNLAGSGSANHSSYNPVISDDGRFVAFMSNATDVVVSNPVSAAAYLRDMQTGVTQALSVDPQGTLINTDNVMAISGDGHYVVFASRSAGLVPNLSQNFYSQLYVRDTWFGQTKMASINRFGNAAGDGTSGYTNSTIPEVKLSSDGRYLAFISAASDLVEAQGYPGAKVFLRDFVTETTTLISGAYPGGRSLAAASGVDMTRDGRFIAYSAVPAYFAIPSKCYRSVLVYDRQTDSNTMVSRNQAGGECANGDSSEPAISADGRFVAFTSLATDLVSDPDHNRFTDIYVRDLPAGSTTLLSANRWNTNGGNGNSLDPAISADGRFVSYTTWANDLMSLKDKNQQQDVILYDLRLGTRKLVSAASPQTAGNGASLYSWVSAAGDFVLFTSDGSDLADLDQNRVYDLFVLENREAVSDRAGAADQIGRGEMK